MKKTLSLIALLVLTTMLSAQDIKLPAPQKEGGMPLMEALANRKTDRSYSTKELTTQQLSNLCWAACGENREDGKMTSPTARNAQQIDLYVFNKTGVYLYDRKNNTLKEVKKGDFRSHTAKSGMFHESPVILVFVANNKKMDGWDKESIEFYGATDTGFASQNVYLYCASEKLNTCVLGHIHRDKIKELLGFDGKATLAQAVGFPK